MINFGFKVSLRAVAEEDFEPMFTWRNDPKIWRWTRQNDLLTKLAHLEWFEKLGSDPKIKMYVIETLSKGVAASVGVCGLTDIDYMNRRAEFSLYISPDFWGDKLGEKSLKTLFTHGFKNLGLNLIWGESFDGNPAIPMFSRLGMVNEGTRRDFYFRDGKHIDAHLFSVRASEWKYYPHLSPVPSAG